MKVKQIGDWTLEDRLVAGGPPVVVMFRNVEGTADRLRRIDFRRVAQDHPEANFHEVDLIENPSVKTKYRLSVQPVVLVFVDGAEVARHVGPFIGPTIARLFGPCRQEEGGA